MMAQRPLFRTQALILVIAAIVLLPSTSRAGIDTIARTTVFSGTAGSRAFVNIADEALLAYGSDSELSGGGFWVGFLMSKVGGNLADPGVDHYLRARLAEDAFCPGTSCPVSKQMDLVDYSRQVETPDGRRVVLAPGRYAIDLLGPPQTNVSVVLSFPGASAESVTLAAAGSSNLTSRTFDPVLTAKGNQYWNRGYASRVSPGSFLDVIMYAASARSPAAIGAGNCFSVGPPDTSDELGRGLCADGGQGPTGPFIFVGVDDQIYTAGYFSLAGGGAASYHGIGFDRSVVSSQAHLSTAVWFGLDLAQ